MIQELHQQSSTHRESIEPTDGPAIAAPQIATLIFTEQAAGSLRHFIARNGHAHYRIFHGVDIGLDDVEDYLEPLGECAQWEPLPAASPGGEPLSRLTFDQSRARTSGRRGCSRSRRTVSISPAGTGATMTSCAVFGSAPPPAPKAMPACVAS